MKEDMTLIEMAEGLVNYATDGGMFEEKDKDKSRVLLVLVGEGEKCFGACRSTEELHQVMTVATFYANNVAFREMIKAVQKMVKAVPEFREMLRQSEEELEKEKSNRAD